MDAYTACRLPRRSGLDGGLCHLDLLRSSRGGKILWFMDAREIKLGRGCHRIQPGDIGLLRRKHDWRSWNRRVPPALYRFVHVILYPTINSKGISCFRNSEHGAVAGVILFFISLSAVLGPLARGAISDAFGDPKDGFILATGSAAVLFIGLLLNWIFNPTRSILRELDVTEYQAIPAQNVSLEPQR